jgi:RNA polymerase sigma-70 factor (ECF subfamily)
MGSAGRQQAMQKLVEEHYASLYRYAFRLAGSATEAEDLTQEAYCKAQDRFDQLRDVARARPWLFAILRNLFLHRIQDAQHNACVSLDGVGEVCDPAVAEPFPEIDQEQLQRALQELPEKFRTPVILFYFEEFSYRDIAEQMELPIGTVMSRLARAKAHLRSRLLGAGGIIATNGARPRRATDGL